MTSAIATGRGCYFPRLLLEYRYSWNAIAGFESGDRLHLKVLRPRFYCKTPGGAIARLQHEHVSLAYARTTAHNERWMRATQVSRRERAVFNDKAKSAFISAI